MGIQQNMADKIRLMKDQRPQSLSELSEELEISRSTLQGYLRGQGNPSLEMVEHLAKKMKVDPIVLLSGMLEPTQEKVLLLLLETIRELASLPEDKRLRFAELFLNMIQLWETEE